MVSVGDATVWIGWDPMGKKIRAWLFDSTGGFGDGSWNQEGDLRRTAQIVSCHQEIASDGAFSLGMIADFTQTIRAKGAWWYRRCSGKRGFSAKCSIWKLRLRECARQASAV